MGDLIVMLESPDSTRSVAFGKILLQQIRQLPWVDHAEMGREDSIFTAHKLLFMDLEDVEEVDERFRQFLRQKTEAANPLLVDLTGKSEAHFDISDIEAKYQGAHSLGRRYMSADHQILLLMVTPKGLTSDMNFARRIYRDLSELVAKEHKAPEAKGIQTSVGGTYKNRIDEYNTILSDVASSGLLGVAVIILQLLLYFRKPLRTMALALTLGASLCWTFAWAHVTVGELNLITAFLAIVLFGLGIDFGIHLLGRYLGERRLGQSHTEALVAAIQHGGRSCFTAAATTTVAFFFLTFSDFLGFRHFGWIAGWGIVISYGAFLILFPALLHVMEELHPLRVNIVSSQNHLSTDSISSSSSPWIRRILLGGVLLSLLAIAFLPRVEFENDFRNLRARIPASREFNRKVAEVFPQARDPSAVLVADRAEALRVRDTLYARWLQDSTTPLADIKTIQTIVPADQDEKFAIFEGIRTTLAERWNQIPVQDRPRIDSLVDMLPRDTFSLQDVPEYLRRNFIGLPGSSGQIIYLYQRNSLMDLREARRFADAVGTFSIAGKTYHAISEPIIYVDLVRILERDAIIATFGIFLALLGIVYLDLRNWRNSLLALAPTGLGFLWMLGGMGILGIKLNLFNLVVIPSILGLAVDAGVHIYHRFQESGRTQFRRALRETGGASLLSTTTTMGGFGSLLLASHPGLRSLGELAVLGMSASVLLAVIFLPTALIYLDSRRR